MTEPETLGEFDIIEPGAFKTQIGKTVPVWNQEHTKKIGTATVLDEDGTMSIELTSGDNV
jgi:hypothetical protein